MLHTSRIRPQSGRARPAMIPGTLCSVTLIDRRTGRALRVNGQRLTIHTRTPDLAAAELLSGRNPAHWELRIEAMDIARRH